MSRFVVDPDGLRLPIKIDSTSNGEFAPVPLDKVQRMGNQWARRDADGHRRKQGIGRRRFMVSACGVASTLLAVNAANAAAGRVGGYFAVPQDAAKFPDLAATFVDGDELIFDVQGHYVDPQGNWLKQVPSFARPFAGMPQADCERGKDGGPRAYLDCLGPEQFVQDVFMDSDTQAMVLSFVPSRLDAEPVTIAAADATRRIVESLEGSHRLFLHGRVNPNQAGDMERMDELVERWKISAWKTYTQWGVDGKGYYLSDERTGVPFIEKARALGMRVICVHKGLPLSSDSYEHSQCSDIGVVAKRFPDVAFIIYHSGFVAGKAERAYLHSSAADLNRDGIDTLVKSLLDNEVAPNSNVYAELGSTWRYLMRDPDSAAHALGKLFKYVGENNVLWGTDSIWYGSPQDQIQAFRTFQIAEPLRQAHGYPEITPELRRKVFGLNALVPYGLKLEDLRQQLANDSVAVQRRNYRNETFDPHFGTYGPKTRREFLRFKNYE